METKSIKNIMLILLTAFVTVIIVCSLLMVFYLKPTPMEFRDSGATLAFIAVTAVSIERSIEAFWTFYGGIKGSYWPLSAITRQVDALVTELDLSLQPFYEQAEGKLQSLKNAGVHSMEDIDGAINEINRLKNRFNELKTLTPDNQRVQLLTAAANQNINYISEKYGHFINDLDKAKKIAGTSINGLQDFLATFKDNPGRRLISIFLGAIIGIICSTLFSLNMFSAVFFTTTQFPIAGIIFTGLIIGLGSSPTHEAIRALQEYKKARKGDNIATPNLPN